MFICLKPFGPLWSTPHQAATCLASKEVWSNDNFRRFRRSLRRKIPIGDTRSCLSAIHHTSSSPVLHFVTGQRFEKSHILTIGSGVSIRVSSPFSLILSLISFSRALPLSASTSVITGHIRKLYHLRMSIHLRDAWSLRPTLMVNEIHTNKGYKLSYECFQPTFELFQICRNNRNRPTFWSYSIIPFPQFPTFHSQFFVHFRLKLNEWSRLSVKLITIRQGRPSLQTDWRNRSEERAYLKDFGGDQV